MPTTPTSTRRLASRKACRGLPDAAKTVQVRDGQTHVKNGTYQTEVAAGYAVYEADSLDAALALAARIPAARLGGAVEVRPAEKYW